MDELNKKTNFSSVLNSKTWKSLASKEIQGISNYISIRKNREDDFSVTRFNPHSKEFKDSFDKGVVTKSSIGIVQFNPVQFHINNYDLPTSYSSLLSNSINYHSNLVNVSSGESFRLELETLFKNNNLYQGLTKYLLSDLKIANTEMHWVFEQTKIGPEDISEAYNKMLLWLLLSSLHSDKLWDDITRSNNGRNGISVSNTGKTFYKRLVNVYEAVPGELYCFSYIAYTVDNMYDYVLMNYWFDINILNTRKISEPYAIYQNYGLNNMLTNLLGADMGLRVSKNGKMSIEVDISDRNEKLSIPLKDSEIQNLVDNRRISAFLFNLTPLKNLSRIFNRVYVPSSFHDLLRDIGYNAQLVTFGPELANYIKNNTLSKNVILLSILSRCSEYGYSYQVSSRKMSIPDPIIDSINKTIKEKELNRLKEKEGSLVKYPFTDKLVFSS